jgi:hypothetical protein
MKFRKLNRLEIAVIALVPVIAIALVCIRSFSKESSDVVARLWLERLTEIIEADSLTPYAEELDKNEFLERMAKSRGKDGNGIGGHLIVASSSLKLAVFDCEMADKYQSKTERVDRVIDNTNLSQYEKGKLLRTLLKTEYGGDLMKGVAHFLSCTDRRIEASTSLAKARKCLSENTQCYSINQWSEDLDNDLENHEAEEE